MRHPGEEILLAYLDGELGREATAEVERHLEGCVGCGAVVDRFRGASTAFRVHLGRVDELEPASWRGSRLERSSGGGGRPGWPGRWSSSGIWRLAAGFLLFVGVASAAVLQLSEGWISGRSPAGSQAGSPVPGDAGDAGSDAAGSVMVLPSAGVAEVSLTNVGAGTRLEVALEARAEVVVSVSGGAGPRFMARAGRVDADFDGVGAVVRVVFPHALREGTIVADGVAVVRLRAGRLTPEGVSGAGLELGADRAVPDGNDSRRH